MKLWPFGNRKTEVHTTTADSPVAEVREYYDASRHERQGLAWFLAFATLIITLLIVVGLFFGGRWLYNKIKHKDNTENTTATTQQTDQNKSSESGQKQSTGTSQPASNSSTSGNSGTQTSETGSQGSTTSTNMSNTGTSSTSTNTSNSTGSSSAQQPAASTPATPTTTPATGSALANTGPGNVLAIAGFTAIISGIAYRFVLRKRLSV